MPRRWTQKGRAQGWFGGKSKTFKKNARILEAKMRKRKARQR